MYFEELTVVDDSTDNLVHIVGLVGAVGDDFVERILEAVDGVFARKYGSLFEVVLGNEADEAADFVGKKFGIKEVFSTTTIDMRD